MSLKYDFDIIDVVPTAIFDDPKLADMMQSAGITQDGSMNKVALFRHQATIDAIRTGPPCLRAYFEAAGFGIRPSGRMIADGYYLAEEDAAFTQIVGRLNDNLHLLKEKPAVVGAPYDSGFSFADFMSHIVSAKPTEPLTANPANLPHRSDWADLIRMGAAVCVIGALGLAFTVGL